MESTKHKIIIFGVQGSGKGTQAELLARACNFVYVSTGDAYRREVELATDLGKQVQKIIDSGSLAPDEITNKLVAKRLTSADCHEQGFVLDGYPRNEAQQKALADLTEIAAAVEIKISDEEAVARLSGRLACRCGLSYHAKARPPKKEGICDVCDAQLYMRDDDKPEAIKERIAIYHKQTEPLLESYREQGLLHTVNGEQEIRQVFTDIAASLHLDCNYPD
ncbi:adenylate kinase [bacterium]|nr:adenylate kinase [bacterium]